MTQTKSQTQRIFAHISKGWAITPMQALNKFGCLRLAARINDLKKLGIPVVSKMVHKNGVKFASYTLGGYRA